MELGGGVGLGEARQGVRAVRGVSRLSLVVGWLFRPRKKTEPLLGVAK
jgi:hypothetical protein